jgi:hypothetical protein
VAVLRQQKQLIIGPGSIASQTIAVSGVGRPLVSLASFTRSIAALVRKVSSLNGDD